MSKILANRLSTECITIFETEEAMKELKRKIANAKGKRKTLIDAISNDVLNFGGRTSSDGDWGENWFVFKGELTDEEIFERLTKMDVIEDTDRGAFDDNDWDCSGKTMMNRPHIRKRTSTRVLVTQCWSLDI